MNIRFNDGELHFAREDQESRYIVEGITDVIDPHAPLCICLQNKKTIVQPPAIQARSDDTGNLYISISLSSSTRMIASGVLPIDDTLIKVLEDTQLHALVKGRRGCLAVSGYEIVCTNS